MTDNQPDLESALDRAVGALREMPALAEPDDAFRQRLVNLLNASDKVPPSLMVALTHRRVFMHRIAILAASVVIVFAAIGWIISWNGSRAGSAFAQMLERVDKAGAVVFRTRVKMRGLPDHEMQSKTMWLDSNRVRDEITEGKDRDLTIHIYDLERRKWLTLVPAAKKARLRNLDDRSTAQPRNIIDQIRQARESSAELLGKEQIDGKETLKYRCNHPTGHYLIWVSSDTDLPMKVVMSESGANDAGNITVTMTDFEWNALLDPLLFALVVPEGYELEQQANADPAADSESFVFMLRVYVRLNDDKFPDELNAMTLSSIGQLIFDPNLPDEEREAEGRRKLAHAMRLPDPTNMTPKQRNEAMPDLGRTFAQGAGFLGNLLQTHDWHYVGKGVKLGEADKIVAWWTSKNETGSTPKSEQDKSATVLYGDLHVESKPVADLPRGN